MDINIEPLKDFTSANINDIYAETNIKHNHEYVVCYNSNDTFIIIIIIIIIIIFFLYQTLFYLKVGEKKSFEHNFLFTITWDCNFVCQFLMACTQGKQLNLLEE